MTTNLKIDPYGFREYDARWLYEKDINQLGIENLGKGLGTQIIKHTKKTNPRVIVGHDYRSYSEEIKSALKKGLLSTGCNIEDIGLSLSPTVYFAQFNLDADAVAMVTASHNENGWTGVKMGIKKGLTHAPEEMKELKEITLNENFIKGEGSEKQIEGFQQIYKDDLINKNKITKKIKAVVACGNGTAGIFAPEILRGIGCEVIELDCNLDCLSDAQLFSMMHFSSLFIGLSGLCKPCLFVHRVVCEWSSVRASSDGLSGDFVGEFAWHALYLILRSACFDVDAFSRHCFRCLVGRLF